jgi:hypothetical protein
MFKIPKINMFANDYIDLIDWNLAWKDDQRTEPHLTKHIDVRDLELILVSKNWPSFHFLRFSCHTQSVERHIRMVSEASQNVFGGKKKGWI